MSLPPRVLSERPTTGPLVDPFGRRHTYVRVSVTDRCNYRCVYCLPAEPITWMGRDEVLSFEEIARIVRVFAAMGVERIRLTGGEPTVRRGVEHLVALLGEIPGVRDLSMTTNGHLFARRAAAFAAAGLSRVNISIDSLDPAQFARITRGGDLARVLDAVDAAVAAGLHPVKLNAVVVRGENEDQVDALVDRFAPLANVVSVRFIEEMPFGSAVRRNVPSAEIRARLSRRLTLDPIEAVGGGPAVTWRIRETGLVVGFISPITEHFCQTCNRLRLTADGHLRTCLSRDPVPSLRDVLRGGATDAELETAIRAQVWGKVAGHEAHLDRPVNFEGVMTHIGG